MSTEGTPPDTPTSGGTPAPLPAGGPPGGIIGPECGFPSCPSTGASFVPGANFLGAGAGGPSFTGGSRTTSVRRAKLFPDKSPAEANGARRLRKSRNRPNLPERCMVVVFLLCLVGSCLSTDNS